MIFLFGKLVGRYWKLLAVALVSNENVYSCLRHSFEQQQVISIVLLF